MKVRIRTDVEPREALCTPVGWDATNAFALVASPATWQIVRLTAKGDPINCHPDTLDEAFELCAFDPSTQLTWIRSHGAPTGCATVLTETDDFDAGAWTNPGDLDVRERIPRSHLLWGRAEPIDDETTLMRASRIVGIRVPIALRLGVRVRVVGEELVGLGPDGNAMIVAERLIRFEEAPLDENDD